MTKVNTGVSMAIKRALQQRKAAGDSDKQIGDAASRIYKLMWDGEYEDEAGVRRRARGDISKINRIVGLTPTENIGAELPFHVSENCWCKTGSSTDKPLCFQCSNRLWLPSVHDCNTKRAAFWSCNSLIAFQKE